MSARLHRPDSLAAATALTGEFRAGGSDVQERRRSGRSTGDLVDLTGIAGLSAIEPAADGGVRIGALVSVHRIATDPALGGYPALQRSAGALATPQLRRQGTLGGNLAQQVRCTYFRNELFDCLRTGGARCPARDGWHGMHVIFDNGGCVAPHASTVAVALLTYDAVVHVAGGADRTVAQLYGDLLDPRHDHALAEGEIITGITLPPPTAGERAHYMRAISRARAEWPLVEVTARLVLTDGVITTARVAVGGVARMPMALPDVDSALIGNEPTAGLLLEAASRAAADANPLPGTRCKVPLLRNALVDALEHCV